MATVGTPVTPEQLNALMGPSLKAVDEVLNSGEWLRMAEFFDATTDAVLLAAPYNWTQEQINTVKAAFNEMQDVQTLWNEPNGARFFAKQIWGL